MSAKCWADNDAGAICAESATTIDPVRGCTVCEEHERGGDAHGNVGELP